jgi:hypothetical protein
MKYLELEQQYEKERQEKAAMENYIQSTHVLPAPSKNLSLGNDQTISDLLILANEELERKSKLLSKLQSKIEYLEGKNLENLNEEQLEGLRMFYGSKLSSIVATLTNLTNKQK